MKLERGDWVIDRMPMKDLCYEVRGIVGDRVLLCAFHVRAKTRFNCSSPVGDLMIIRKKDGTKVDPPTVVGVR